MSYGIFASKEEHDEWMRSWISAQNDLADLNYKVIQKQRELVTEGVSSVVSQTLDSEQKQILESAMSILGQAVGLLSAVVKGLNR